MGSGRSFRSPTGAPGTTYRGRYINDATWVTTAACGRVAGEACWFETMFYGVYNVVYEIV